MATSARRTPAKKTRVSATNATVKTAREFGVPTTTAGAIDLDTIERVNPVQPLRVHLDGDLFEIHDPTEKSWQDLQFMDSASVPIFLRTILGSDYERFAEHELPLWKVQKFAEILKQHFNLDPAAQGNGPASPTS